MYTAGTGSTGAYSGEAAAVAEDDDPFEKPPGGEEEGDTIRVEVQF